jgi:hypothetical protein
MKFVAHKISGDVFRVVGSLPETPGYSVITARNGTLYTIFDDLLTPADQPTDWFPLRYYICPKESGYLTCDGSHITFYCEDGDIRKVLGGPCSSCKEVSRTEAEATIWIDLPVDHKVRPGIDWFRFFDRNEWEKTAETANKTCGEYPSCTFRCLKIHAPEISLRGKAEELGFSLVGGVPGGMLYFRASDEALKD